MAPPLCAGAPATSNQDHTATAIARDFAAVFAWKGETLQEYWWCTDRCLDWGPDGDPDLIVDDGGDATLLIHEGVKAEEEFEKTGKPPDSASTDNAEFQIVLGLIRDGLKTDPKRFHKIKERLVGVSEETSTGVKRLYQMQANRTLLFPAIHVNDSVTKGKAGHAPSPACCGSTQKRPVCLLRRCQDLLRLWRLLATMVLLFSSANEITNQSVFSGQQQGWGSL